MCGHFEIEKGLLFLVPWHEAAERLVYGEFAVSTSEGIDRVTVSRHPSRVPHKLVGR